MNSTIGKMREWIQRNAINGSSVIWGSDEILRFRKNQSVRFFEELALELSQDKEIEILKTEKAQKQLCIDNLKGQLVAMEREMEALAEYKWKYEELCK